MPLLQRESEISPRSPLDLAGEAPPWWVAHTRSRQEKALARHLLPLGVSFYLPQVEKRVRRSGRTLTSYLPLFPGYVFFRGAPRERQLAIQSRLIVQVLEVLDQDLLAKELLQLHRLKESGAELVPYQALRPGDAVRVQEGPFQGYSGVVLRGQARLRLVVSITMLRQSVAVEFDRAVLTPAAPSPSFRGVVSVRHAVA